MTDDDFQEFVFPFFFFFLHTYSMQVLQSLALVLNILHTKKIDNLLLLDILFLINVNNNR